jgi:hypothetical protein
MVNLKKLDDQDIVVINEVWTEGEKQAFSNFLKKRKVKPVSRRSIQWQAKVA